jgi:diguanylate cyclase (GGDEF)-like protein/PAS domain S-box-containing protein
LRRWGVFLKIHPSSSDTAKVVSSLGSLPVTPKAEVGLVSTARRPVDAGSTDYSTHPDLLGLLSRVGCHVYSGEVLPDGEYREIFTGPGLEELVGVLVGPGVDATAVFHAAVHPDDWDVYLLFGTQMATDSTASIEYRLVQGDGTVRWVLDRMWLRERLPNGASIVDGVIADVTELRARTDEARAALRAVQRVNAELERARAEVVEATAWLEAAVTATPAALILLDRDFRTQLWNPAAERMFGWSRDEALGQVAPHVPPEQWPHLRGLVDRFLAGESLIESEELRSGRDGHPRQVSMVSVPVRGTGGKITGILGVITDITNRKEMETRLRYLAHNDTLTGLANRVALTARIDEALARRASVAQQVSVLLLDLDGFKAVNDSFGHGTGDELLTAVSQRLSACLRTGDVAARLGGDEFAVLLETSTRAEAMAVSARVLRALSGPVALGRAQVVVTASIGVVHAGKHQTTQELLRDADVAMYTAKTSGKNRLVVFKPAMQQRVAKRLHLETQLRRAVELSHFQLHYQPFQDLTSGRIVGVEALVRWRHPRRGLLPPSEFISTTEETGLIVPLGRWILEAACTEAARWRSRYGAAAPSVSVNLSPRQLQDPELVTTLSRTLSEAGLDGSALHVEITENLLMSDSDLASSKLAELRALGVGVAVDDFGTGYSSLAYLRRYPVDVLKIDRSFVAPLPEGPRPAALVRSIIELARALDVGTVAEGVENADQARILRDLGCNVAQGFFLCRPQTADALDELLKAQLSR